jgi:hypothetical protein
MFSFAGPQDLYNLVAPLMRLSKVIPRVTNDIASPVMRVTAIDVAELESRPRESDSSGELEFLNPSILGQPPAT